MLLAPLVHPGKDFGAELVKMVVAELVLHQSPPRLLMTILVLSY